MFIRSDSPCNLLHSGRNINKCIDPVGITCYNYQTIIREQVASLKTFFRKKIYPLVGAID